eukprot:5558573-Amphidinium_carterae.1
MDHRRRREKENVSGLDWLTSDDYGDPGLGKMLRGSNTFTQPVRFNHTVRWRKEDVSRPRIDGVAPDTRRKLVTLQTLLLFLTLVGGTRRRGNEFMLCKYFPR